MYRRDGHDRLLIFRLHYAFIGAALEGSDAVSRDETEIAFPFPVVFLDVGTVREHNIDVLLVPIRMHFKSERIDTRLCREMDRLRLNWCAVSVSSSKSQR